MIAPVVKSPGSKWRVADEIVAMLPPHRIYLEPFAGSGAVFFSKTPSYIETLNDANGEIVNLYRVLRDAQPRERLLEAVEFTPWAEEELWAACESAEGLNDVERARRLIVRSWQNTGSRTIGVPHFAYAGTNSGGSSGKTWATLPEGIRVAGDRLSCVQVLCRDAREVIEAHADENVLIYADPPYPASTRKGAGHLYRHEMDDGEHKRLLEALRGHPGPVLLSGFQCPLYEEILWDWKQILLRGYAQSHEKTSEAVYLNPEAAGRGLLVLF